MGPLQPRPPGSRPGRPVVKTALCTTDCYKHICNSRECFAGNSCRSPIAEAVFVKLLKEAGKQDDWIVDSGAIASWNVGKDPEERAISVLNKHNISTSHKGRQVYQKCIQYLSSQSNNFSTF